MYALELKRRDAERLVARYDPKKRSKLSSKTGARPASAASTGRVARVAVVPEAVAAQPQGSRYRNRTAALRGRGPAHFMQAMLPKGANAPKVPTVTSRIPLFPSKSPTSQKAAAAATRNTVVTGRLRPPLALNFYGSSSSFGSLGSQNSLGSIKSDGGGALSSALVMGAPAASASPTNILGRPNAAGMLGGAPPSGQELQRRRSTAAAAKAVLTLSEIDGVDAPSRRRFPPGAGSLAKFNSYQTMHGSPSYGALPTAGGSIHGSPSYGALPTVGGSGGGGVPSRSLAMSSSASIAALPAYERRGSYKQAGPVLPLAASPAAAGSSAATSRLAVSQSAAALPTLSQRSKGKLPAAQGGMRSSEPGSRYIVGGHVLHGPAGSNEQLLAEEGSCGVRAPVVPGAHNV